MAKGSALENLQVTLHFSDKLAEKSALWINRENRPVGKQFATEWSEESPCEPWAPSSC